MLGATSDNVTVDCPTNIALFSLDGQKNKITLEDITEYQKHHLGQAILGNVLKAEEKTNPTDEAAFNLATNNCVHYARSLWRLLDFPESDELARFVIENVVNDPNFDTLARQHAGGVRYMAAKTIGGIPAFTGHVEDVVYSQFIIE